MSKIKVECGTCHWYDAIASRSGSGFCTVNPPTVIMDSSGIARSYRPMIDADSHECREWEEYMQGEREEKAPVTATAPKPVPIPPAPKVSTKKSK